MTGLDALITVLSNTGLGVALALFFVYHQARREEYMRLKVDRLESYVTNELTHLVAQCIDALDRNTRALDEFIAKVDAKSSGSEKPEK